MPFDFTTLRQFSTRPALLIPGNRTLSYADLADRAETFAATLGKTRKLVAIETAPTLAPLIAHVGALAAGHVVMPLPANADDQRRALEHRFRPDASYRQTGGRWRLLRDGAGHADLHPDLALVLQTSGSTGHGQGVRLSRQGVAANARAIGQYLELTPQDRAGLILPWHYSYGLSVLHSHLMSGASVCLLQGSVLDPGFRDQFAAAGCTNLAGVPHSFDMLDSIGFLDALPDSLKFMTVAGGAMAPPRVRQMAQRMQARQGRFYVMYGQTEATARIAYLPPDLAAARPDAIGTAIPGGQLMLVDDAGQIRTTPEAEGELAYCGPNVMMGYARSRADLARGGEVKVLKTGDLARRDAAGLYRITGRKSRISKIAGLRIGHDALERALTDQGIRAAVWGDDTRIQVAAITAEGNLDALARQVARLSGLRPGQVQAHCVQTLPRLSSGKIDYRALARDPDTQAPPRDMLRAFSLAFGHRAITPDDSFASLQGDSLRHVELSLALQQKLGSVPGGWEQMPIRALERMAAPRRASLPTDMVMRVLAILAVVTQHQTSLPLWGGAAAMIVLLGISIGRFRLQPLAQGNLAAFLAPMLRVLLPYYLILAAYAMVWGQVPWVSVLLAGNFALTTPETHLMLPYLYWFIEAYAQMTVLMALPFVWAAPRRWLARDPFAVGLGFLALAVLARVTLPEIWPMQGRALFSVPWVFFLLALGWCVATARTRARRALVFALACVILPGAAWMGGSWFGAWTKYTSLLAMVGILLLWRDIPLPRQLTRPLLQVAEASFYIYLLHRFVPELILPTLGLTGHSLPVNTIAILGGVALGLAAVPVQRLAQRVLNERRRRPVAAAAMSSS